MKTLGYMHRMGTEIRYNVLILVMFTFVKYLGNKTEVPPCVILLYNESLFELLI